MSLKVRSFSLALAYASPKLIGSCECDEGDTNAKLKLLLEGIYIVDWPFQSFDIESRCKINYKLEGFNRVFFRIYMFYHYLIPTLNLGSAWVWLT